MNFESSNIYLVIADSVLKTHLVMWWLHNKANIQNVSYLSLLATLLIWLCFVLNNTLWCIFMHFFLDISIL